jgi:hypothetical protein
MTPRTVQHLRPLIAMLAMVACGGDSSGPATPSSIRFTSDTAAVFIDDTVQLSAQVVLSNGRAADTASITFQSSNPAVLTVLPSGKAVGLTAGTATITARSGALQATQTRTAYAIRANPDLRMTGSGGLTIVTPAAEIAAGPITITRQAGTDPIVPGNVLLTTADGGYIRRVTSVSGTGTTQTAQTVEALLTEAFDDLDVELNVVPNLQGALRQAYREQRADGTWPEGVELLPDGRLALVNYPVNFTNTTSSGQASVSSSFNGAITLNFSNFDGKLNFKTTVGIPTGLKRLRAVANIGAGLNGRATTTLSGNFGSLINFPSFERDVVKFTVGTYCPTICFTINLRLVVYIQPFAAISGTFAQDLSANYGATVGVDYQNNSWGSVFVPNANNGFSIVSQPFTLGGSVGIAYGVRPLVEVLVMNVAGPNIGVDVGSTLQAGVRNNGLTWFVEGESAIGLALGARVVLLGFQLASFSQVITLEQTRFPFFKEDGATSSLTMSPATVSVGVGQSRALSPTMTLNAGGVSIPPGPIVCTSSNPAVASVSGCTVNGVANGSATITASSTLEPRITRTVPVTVAPTQLATLSPTTIAAVHTYAQSSCPQALGSVLVTNTSGGVLRWTTTTNRPQIAPSTQGPANILAAGQSMSVPMRFDCSSTESTTATVMYNFTMDGSGATQSIPVTVNLTVVGAPTESDFQ